MTNYYGYPATGTGTVASATETVIMTTQIPDNREPLGLGVAITGMINFVSATGTQTATIRVRQGTGTTGAVIGTALVVATSTGAPVNYPFMVIDQTGTYPLTQYSCTMINNSAIGTVNYAAMSAQALGE